MHCVLLLQKYDVWPRPMKVYDLDRQTDRQHIQLAGSNSARLHSWPADRQHTQPAGSNFRMFSRFTYWQTTHTSVVQAAFASICTIHQLTDHTYKCRPGSICARLRDSPADRPHIQVSSRQHLRPSPRFTNWQTTHTSVVQATFAPVCTNDQLTDNTYKWRPGSICAPLHEWPTDRQHIQVSSRQNFRSSARFTNWQTAHTSVVQAAFPPVCTIHQLTDHTYNCRPGSICAPLHDSPTDRPHIQVSSRQHLHPSARFTNWQTTHTTVVQAAFAPLGTNDQLADGTYKCLPQGPRSREKS